MSNETDRTTGTPGAWIAGAGAMHPSVDTHGAASVCSQSPFWTAAVTAAELVLSGASGQEAAVPCPISGAPHDNPKPTSMKPANKRRIGLCLADSIE